MTSTATYLVQRQETFGGDWRPLVSCNSLEYAELIAAAGLRAREAIAYGAVNIRTGEASVLLPQLESEAA